MAIIKKQELKQMKITEVKKKLLELKKELVKINIQIALGTLPENPGRVKEIKKTIARLTAIKLHNGGETKVE
jgi:large subunit ribosomal protein L29